MDTNEDSRQSRIPDNDLNWKLHVCQSSPEKATKITNRDGSEFITQLMIDT